MGDWNGFEFFIIVEYVTFGFRWKRDVFGKREVGDILDCVGMVAGCNSVGCTTEVSIEGSSFLYNTGFDA